MTALRFPLTRLLPLLSLSLLAVPPLALAQDATVRVVIQDHHFQPEELHAPAGRDLVIEVENRDAAVEEFESYDLDREQRVKPGETLKVRLAALSRGRYPFFGDFHRRTAQGVLVVE